MQIPKGGLMPMVERRLRNKRERRNGNSAIARELTDQEIQLADSSAELASLLDDDWDDDYILGCATQGYVEGPPDEGTGGDTWITG